MPTTVGILTLMSRIDIYEQGKFHSLKKKYNLEPSWMGYFVKNMIQATPLMRNMLVQTIHLKHPIER